MVWWWWVAMACSHLVQEMEWEIHKQQGWQRHCNDNNKKPKSRQIDLDDSWLVAQLLHILQLCLGDVDSALQVHPTRVSPPERK